MSKWEVTLEDGSVHTVEADSEQEAGQKALDEAAGRAPVTAGGMAKQALPSLAHGMAYVAGLPGTIGDITGGVIEKGLNKLGFDTSRDPATQKFFEAHGMPDPSSPSPFSGAGLSKKLDELTGGYTARQPQNPPEEYVRSMMEFGPMGFLTGGPKGFVTQGMVPGAISETAGQMARRYLPDTRPSWMPDWVPDKETSARIIGAMGSPFLLGGGRRALTPHPTTPGRIKAAKILKQEGVEFSAGQKTGATRLRYAEANTGRYADDLQNRQAEQFSAAALKRIGVAGSRADPEALVSADTRIGNMFNRLSSQYDINAGQNKLVSDMMDGWDWYKQRTNKATRMDGVEKQYRGVIDMVRTRGGITGKEYQGISTDLRRLAKGADPNSAMAINKLRRALDDAMETSIQRANPDDVGAWRVAREQYKNLLMIEDAVSAGGGAAAAEGIITPDRLAQAAMRYGGRRAYVQGKVDLGELAKAGKVLLQKLPNSGTPGHLRAMALPTIAAGLGGGGATLGAQLFGAPGAVAGAAAGVLGPALYSAGHDATLMSKPVQNYLKFQLLKKTKPGSPEGGLLRFMQQEEAIRNQHKGGGYVPD